LPRDARARRVPGALAVRGRVRLARPHGGRPRARPGQSLTLSRRFRAEPAKTLTQYGVGDRLHKHHSIPRRAIDCRWAHGRGRGELIPWIRVNKLPEFTYFPHKAHLRANVKCQTCHGPVEAMTTFGAVTGPRLTNDLLNLVGLRPAAPPLTMGWCLDCHRRQN